MTKNQKILNLYFKYNRFDGYNAKRISEEESVDYRTFSYLKTIEKGCSEKEFKILVEAIATDSFVYTSSNEKTKSLEALAKAIKQGHSIVEVTTDYMILYLLKSDDKIKIGVAKSIVNRLKLLQTGNPYTIELLAQYRFASEILAREQEKLLHEKYRSKKAQGGWFDLSDTEYIELCTELDNSAAVRIENE